MITEQFDKLVKSHSNIVVSLGEHAKYAADKRHYDKVGLEFNRDDRFTCFRMNLFLSSWCGTYGSSSCYTAFEVGDSAIFQAYFLRWLNGNVEGVMREIAKLMEKDIAENRDAKIKELQAEIDKLNGIGKVEES